MLIVFQHGTVNAFVMIGLLIHSLFYFWLLSMGHHSKTMATELFKSFDHKSGSSMMVM